MRRHRRLMRLVGVAAGPLGASLAVSPGRFPWPFFAPTLSDMSKAGSPRGVWGSRCPPWYQIGAYLPVLQSQHILCHFSAGDFL